MAISLKTWSHIDSLPLVSVEISEVEYTPLVVLDRALYTTVFASGRIWDAPKHYGNKVDLGNGELLEEKNGTNVGLENGPKQNTKYIFQELGDA